MTVETLYPWMAVPVRILFIVAIAYTCVRILRRLIPRLQAYTEHAMRQHAGVPNEMEKRASTIAGIVQKTAIFLIWGAVLMMSLREVGFDIAPILAGAGVAGLAVGFGAQNFVRDVISGMIMLIENQIRINDVAVINGTGGLVEEINLRTTVLRGLDGAVHVFPNGSINTLSNMTREFSYYVFDIRVSYKEDTDRVAALMRQVSQEMMQEEKFKSLILSPLEILGIDQLTDSAAVLKARIKTLPIQQWNVGRELNRRINKSFQEQGVEIPFPHRILTLNRGSQPIRSQTEQSLRREVREIVNAVLQERRQNRESRGADNSN